MRFCLPLLLVACSGKVEPVNPGTGTPAGTPGGTPTVTPTVPPLALGLPEGMLAYFDDEGCPLGWSEWSPGVGRALVSVTLPDEVGVEVGTALDSAAPRSHSHDIAATFDIPGAGISGLSSCCNSSPGRSGQRESSGPTESTDSTIPTLALQICRLDQGTDDELGNSLPAGTVAFFDRDACPDGMARPANSTGRMVLSTDTAASLGQTLGTELAPQEMRTHTHGATLTVTVPENSLAASSGGNNDPIARGDHQTDTTTDPAEWGLPYAQALLCEVVQEDASEGGDDEELTPGAIVWSTGDCPTAWVDYPQLVGRFAIGKPYGVFAATPYGDPLTDLTQPGHDHTVALDVSIPSQDVALISGCCNSDVGGNGTFDVTGTTDPAPVDIPYIHLRPCLRPTPI